MPQIFKHMPTKQLYARTPEHGTLIYTGTGTWMPTNESPRTATKDIPYDSFPTLYQGLYRWIDVCTK